MPRYEYKVVPAPTKGLRGKGVRGAEARFSYALQELMNGLSGYGWEYVRAETLPSLERSGLTGSSTEWRNVLVFRRLRENDADAFAPELLPAPDAVKPAAAPTAEPVPEPATSSAKNAKPAGSIHTDVEWDNGGEGNDGDTTLSGPLAVLAEFRTPKEKAKAKADATKADKVKEKEKADKTDG